MYIATEVQSHLVCAIKVISKSFAVRNHHCKQITRELSIIRNLSHPNCIKYFAWFHDRQFIYHVMELGEMSLADLLSTHFQGGLPDRTVVKILMHVSRGLSYLHEMGIVHRDIKPSNLLLLNGVVKICDFGSCVQTRSGDLRKSSVGTAPYMAPELVKGQGYSFAVDVWSLGITGHELCTNKLPFDGSYPQEIFRNIVRSPYVPPGHISEKLCRILHQSLEKKPESRPSIKKILDQLFNSFS